jgi:hypothetical protein
MTRFNIPNQVSFGMFSLYLKGGGVYYIRLYSWWFPRCLFSTITIFIFGAMTPLWLMYEYRRHTHTHVYNSAKSPLNHQLCLFDYIIAGGGEYVPPRSNKAQKPRGARVLWLCFAFRPGLCTGVPWRERRTLEWYIGTTQSSACCPYMYVYIYIQVIICVWCGLYADIC